MNTCIFEASTLPPSIHCKGTKAMIVSLHIPTHIFMNNYDTREMEAQKIALKGVGTNMQSPWLPNEKRMFVAPVKKSTILLGP